jgi:uncharacterized protein YwqG
MPQLLQLLAKSSGLKRVAPLIAKEVLPCVRLIAKRARDGSIEIGASKLGGLPDLPEASEWPCRDGAPLSFIAQINVTALPKFDGLDELPPNTLLSFFYDVEGLPWGFDPGDKGGWCVLASPISPAAPLKRRRRPKDLADDGVFKPCALLATVTESLPDPFSRIIEELKLTDSEQDAYHELFEQLDLDEMPGLHHKVMGHAEPIQNDMQLECQLVSNGISCGGPEGYADPRRDALEAGASDWRLLLQVDTDEDAGMEWGDSGRLYYWIKRSSLQSRSFDDVWLILQCS